MVLLSVKLTKIMELLYVVGSFLKSILRSSLDAWAWLCRSENFVGLKLLSQDTYSTIYFIKYLLTMGQYFSIRQI